MKSWVYSHPPDRETAELLGYTVLPHDGRLVAIAPGNLRPSNGVLTFVLEVERVIDMGNHQHVVGTIEDERVDLGLPVGVAPAIGRLKPEGTRGFRRGHPAGLIRFAILRDTSLVSWRRLAKDGADLPPNQAVRTPSARLIAVGETYDFEFTAERGRYRLVAEIRENALWTRELVVC